MEKGYGQGHVTRRF